MSRPGRQAPSWPPWSHEWFAPVCLVALGGLVYLPALGAPWYFDDLPSIVENGRLRDLGRMFASSLSLRGVAMATFALNYRFAGLDVAGYRAVNVAVHVVAAVLVRELAKRVFPSSRVLPLAVATTFLVHPLQTQAVTYVVQRMASLAGALSLLALWLYTRAREERQAGAPLTSARHVALYALGLVAGGLAVFTKETAAILPLQLALFDRFFVRQSDEPLRRRLAYLAPWLVAPAALLILAVVTPVVRGTPFASLGQSDADASPLAYLLTQAEVVWLYLRLALVPVGQALHYHDTLTGSLASGRTLAALGGLIALVTGALAVRRRCPRLTFGVL